MPYIIGNPRPLNAKLNIIYRYTTSCIEFASEPSMFQNPARLRSSSILRPFPCASLVTVLTGLLALILFWIISLRAS